MCNCKQDQSIKAGDEFVSSSGRVKIIFADTKSVLYEFENGARVTGTVTYFKQHYRKVTPRRKVYTCVARGTNGGFCYSTLDLQVHKSNMNYYGVNLIAQFENEFDVPSCDC